MRFSARDYFEYVQNQKFGDVVAREIGLNEDRLGPVVVTIWQARMQQIRDRNSHQIIPVEPTLAAFMEGMLFGMWLANRKTDGPKE